MSEGNQPAIKVETKKKKKNLKAEGILFCLVSLSLSQQLSNFFFSDSLLFFLVFMCQVQKLLLALFGNRNAYIKCYTHYLPPPFFFNL